jgi:ribose/xylose/arabinose/galactoside ABC-type transport system permease subunit
MISRETRKLLWVLSGIVVGIVAIIIILDTCAIYVLKGMTYILTAIEAALD